MPSEKDFLKLTTPRTGKTELESGKTTKTSIFDQVMTEMGTLKKIVEELTDRVSEVEFENDKLKERIAILEKDAFREIDFSASENESQKEGASDLTAEETKKKLEELQKIADECLNAQKALPRSERDSDLMDAAKRVQSSVKTLLQKRKLGPKVAKWFAQASVKITEWKESQGETSES